MDLKNPQKWASFTCVGKETSYITNVFRQTDLKIAFHTKNTIGKLLTHKNSLDRQTYIRYLEHTNFGADCNKAYVGQTGRRFSTRYKERKTAFCNNNQAYSFAKHLSDAAHSFGRYYTATEKDSAWIWSKGFTSMQNQYTAATWMMTTPTFWMLSLTPY